MSNRVYTYSDITNLNTAQYFHEIAALPQLTMSKEMELHLAKKVRAFKGNTMSFSKFVGRLFPEWNTKGQRFVYVTILNKCIREKIAYSKDNDEKEWLYGCKKNLQFAITNIIRFEEAGIRPEDINAIDRDLKLFVEMWRLLESEDDSINRFRKRVLELQKKDIFDKAVSEIFTFIGGRKQIVWNGFQFFTPIQQLIYDCFIKSGYDIYALIQCEERYPFANEIWNHLYNGKNGYPSKEEWICQKDLVEKNPIGEIFENGKEICAPNIKIIKYNNSVEFVEDVARIKDKGFYIYCADDHSSNRLLKDYYPETYEVRNLLSYPIGQFIYTLHKMWDETEQDIAFDFDGLRKCFSSGWLSYEGKSSNYYTEDLERILPYFTGCYSSKSWDDRLAELKDSFLNANMKLISSSPEDENINISNPLSFFSPFSIDKKRVLAVLAIIRQLKGMAKTLFEEKQPISIQRHMNRLDDLLSENACMSADLYLEERDKVRQIFEVLESDRIKDFICYPGDLAAALLSYMGGHLETDAENNKGLKTLVFNTFQIEAAPLSPSNGKVHICMSDITRLPGNLNNYSWPIDESIVLDIVKRKPGTYLENWIENTRLAALSNRFYVYVACKNKNVEFSWIYQQGDKIYAPSPYITLLMKLSDAKVEKSWVHHIRRDFISNVDEKKRFEKNYSIKNSEVNHSYDNELEYAYCPMRFVYSSVLGDSSTYRSEYSQYKAMVRLIQVLNLLLEDKYSIEDIANQVFEVFPYVRSAERRQMVDDAKRRDLITTDKTSSSIGEKRYTNQRFNLMYLDPNSYAEAFSKQSKMINQEDEGIYYNFNLGDDTRNCELCPHAGYCRKSWFGIDYKNGVE